MTTRETLTRYKAQEDKAWGGRTCDAILMTGEGTFQCTRRDKHDEHEAFDGAQIVEKWRDEDGE